MPEKYIYLDFDGVLHPTDAIKGQLFCQMPLLTTVLNKNSANIIISSSWRLYESLDYLRMLFPKEIRDMVCGCTGSLDTEKFSRYNEIINHATIHKIQDWIALDDAKEMFPPHCRNLIFCDKSKGIQVSQLNDIDLWLSN